MTFNPHTAPGGKDHRETYEVLPAAPLTVAENRELALLEWRAAVDLPFGADANRRRLSLITKRDGGHGVHAEIARSVATRSATSPAPADRASLPDDAALRNQYPMADGLLDYFPNALAEVARLSHVATAQHHPEQGMHWNRAVSKDHRNKIMRHLVDTGKLDDKGQRHSTMVAWRALALLQEELERELSLPPSRASRNI